MEPLNGKMQLPRRDDLKLAFEATLSKLASIHEDEISELQGRIADELVRLQAAAPASKHVGQNGHSPGESKGASPSKQQALHPELSESAVLVATEATSASRPAAPAMSVSHSARLFQQQNVHIMKDIDEEARRAHARLENQVLVPVFEEKKPSEETIHHDKSTKSNMSDGGKKHRMTKALEELRLHSAEADAAHLQLEDTKHKLDALMNGEKQTIPTTGRMKEWMQNGIAKMKCHKEDVKTAKGVVGHPLFDLLAATMIIFSSFLMGLEVESKTMNIGASEMIMDLTNLCSAYFIIELLFRMFAMRRSFFTDENSASWNIFDMALVLLSLVDIMAEIGASAAGEASSQASTTMNSIKTLKMLRVVRVFRVFRFWRQLWDLALMIVHSMKSLALALILLFLVVYVFAVVLTTNASDWLKLQIDTNSLDWVALYKHSDIPGVMDVHSKFGTLGGSIYSLVQCVLGGVSWYEMTNALLYVDTFSPALLFVFIFFTMLSILNIITGVFVDEALSHTQKQKDRQIEQEQEIKAEYIMQLEAFFESVDADGSGFVTLDEIMEMLEDPTLSAYFSVLGFEVDDARRLFMLLDQDNSGEVEIHEFMEGCIKLKGQARSIDVHEIIFECRKLRRLNRKMYQKLFPEDPLSRGNTMTKREDTASKREDTVNSAFRINGV